MFFRLMAFLMLGIATPALAQIVGEPIIANGACEDQSGVTIDGQFSDFGCDVAIITRSEKGTVLIQFTDRSGDDGRIVGFGGTIEGRQGFGADTTQVVAVERLYLAGGAEPVPVTRGTCFLNWSGLVRTGGHLKSVTCGGRGEADDYDIMAIVALNAE